MAVGQLLGPAPTLSAALWWTGAAFLAAGDSGRGGVYTALGAGCLAVVSLLVAALTARTVLAASRGELTRPVPHPTAPPESPR